ncbi:hypothetical protein BT69DRAFT_1277813, partial [Atractiella rhizophila]
MRVLVSNFPLFNAERWFAAWGHVFGGQFDFTKNLLNYCAFSLGCPTEQRRHY